MEKEGGVAEARRLAGDQLEPGRGGASSSWPGENGGGRLAAGPLALGLGVGGERRRPSPGLLARRVGAQSAAFRRCGRHVPIPHPLGLGPAAWRRR